jgi:hypothetical protein
MATSENGNSRDPLIDEVRAIRRAIWEEDGGDLARHFERLKEVERQHRERVVAPPTQPTGKGTTAETV